jgi:arginase
VSRLRAKCPECRTFTAVALGPEYECHACGRVFGAGLVRVPRAWGDGGDSMVEAASLPLPYPEAGVIEEATLGEQTLALASELPERPLVLGGCCCSHVGAVEGLAARHDRLALVWLDAHGDLNTPESSPSGNEWGMPLRMILDAGTVEPRHVALVGARNLDPPEEEFLAESGIATDPGAVDRALDGAGCVYVALDCDVFDPAEVSSFMPEPGGLGVEEVEALFERVRGRAAVVGAGLTGLAPDPANIAPLERLCATLGL